ncbi:MAG TPA: isoprenylcysteine carboxylmethyltransferase family protein [Acidimicrobiales bacterium]|nr:isoprenylcysteine carboxylmethyltransferase family protein [Acidimicrobiales bacterium]
MAAVIRSDEHQGLSDGLAPESSGAPTGWKAPLSLPERLRARYATSHLRLLVAIPANLVGAGGAALFALAGWRHYESTHSFVGAGFFAVQIWVVLAYLARRPASVVSQRAGDWLLAFGGTFGGVLFRPYGAHPHWGVTAGAALQAVGLAICAASLLSLGRSFGFAPADRGLKSRGTYALVRHPVYGSYVFLLLGYVLQSVSLRNVLVTVFVLGCDVGRALAEERLLRGTSGYDEYRAQVRWRLLPGIW